MWLLNNVLMILGSILEHNVDADTAAYLKNKLQALAPRFLPRRVAPATVRRAQERGGA